MKKDMHFKKFPKAGKGFKGIVPALLGLILLVGAPLQASAMEDRFSIRLWGSISPFLTGDAGSGRAAPEYTDLFKTGGGAGGEFSWRLCPYFSWLVGGGYERFGGDTYEGISFDDLDVIPVYIGGKVHALPDDPHWDPYFRLDLGAAHLSSVDLSYQSYRTKYWDDSWVFLFAFGVGTEYRWNAWGVSLDVKFRYLGEPNAALGGPSEAEGSWTVPVTIGINYHF